MRISLRAKIVLLTAGTVALLASVSLIGMGFIAGGEIDRDGRGDVRQTGDVLAKFLTEETQGLTKVSELLAQQPVLRAVIGTHDTASATDTANDLKGQVGCDGVIITDQMGRVLGRSDGSAAADGVPPGAATAIGGKSWSGVQPLAQSLAISITVPVMNGPDLVGTFTIQRRIDAGMADDLKNSLGPDVAFLDRGRIVGSTLTLPSTLHIAHGDTKILKSGGVDYIAAYGPLPGTAATDQIGFVTLRRYDQVMATYNVFRNALLTIALISFLLALAGGALLARSVTTPLDGLVAKARALQRGEWPAPFDSSRADEIGLLQSVFDDMTASVRESHERLKALIHTDPLTGLENHRRFQEHLSGMVNEARESSYGLSLLLLDLDSFQTINQSRGHNAGDAVLTRIADMLRDAYPGVIARYAGDEFAMLLPHVDAVAAEQIAERVREDIERLDFRDAGDQPVTVSIGCSAFPTHSHEPEGLLLAAELAVAQAKELGRNQVCRFDTVPGADSTADPSQLHRFLKDGSLATIQALAAAVDAKDSYTRGHSQSVAQYAADLARALRMPKAEIDLVYTTGTLHDVGKIGVPDAILKKPGRLTTEEREIMATHPVLGEVIIRKAPQLSATLPGVRHHHERWDGAGYPDRLAGESIPYIARLLALADSFDAMTSDRPYRKGMSFDYALGEIETGAGTQFDPALAKAFIAMMRARELPQPTADPRRSALPTERAA